MKTALPYIDYDLRYPTAAGSTLAIQQVAVQIWAIPSSASAGQHVRCSNIGDSVLSGPRGANDEDVFLLRLCRQGGPLMQAPSSTNPPKSAGLARFEGHPDGCALVVYAKRKSSMTNCSVFTPSKVIVDPSLKAISAPWSPSVKTPETINAW